jgi:hypothetical protein
MSTKSTETSRSPEAISRPSQSAVASVAGT